MLSLKLHRGRSEGLTENEGLTLMAILGTFIAVAPHGMPREWVASVMVCNMALKKIIHPRFHRALRDYPEQLDEPATIILM